MKLEEIANVSIGILVHRESVENGKYQYKIFNLNNYEENQEFIVYVLRDIQPIRLHRLVDNSTGNSSDKGRYV